MKTFAGRKLGRKPGPRRALLRSMATSLFQHERIQTTVPKAKEVVRMVERVITLAKKEGVNAHRNVATFIQQKDVQKKIFDVLVPRYQSKQGGYTQVIRSGWRSGDAAPIAVVRLLP